MPAPIRAILFDIGNVLLRFDFTLALTAVGEHSQVHDPVEVLARIDQVKVAYEDGSLDRPSFLRAVFDVLRYRGTEADFITAWENIFTPNEPMVRLVQTLAPHYPLHLLSNTNDIHVAHIFRTYDFFRTFTSGTYSHLARASKPGPTIYEIACRDMTLDPATTFFIDDLLPNIETARTLGFQVHHYHHEQHSALLTALAAAGVPPAALGK